MWIVAGGMPERSSDVERPFNTCAVVAPDGRVAARYRKVHLFDVDLADGSRYRESASTSAGGEPVVADVAGVKTGLSVCYDVRFPELYRALSSRGAELLVVPAAFTLLTGKDHWLVLLRARAIEAQAYVVAAAQWGKHPRGRQTFGKSAIVDPWGEIVAQASEGEGVVTAVLDPAYLARVRDNLPSLRHRRL
jgi:predicted amidohydrolase